MNFLRKCCFSSSLFSNLLPADGHKKFILALKAIIYSLQVYLEIEPSGSQLEEKHMKAMYCVNGTAYVNTANTLILH